MSAKNIKNGKNGGMPSRMGLKLHNKLEEIKDKKLLNGTSKNRLSTEILTNMIANHLSWSEISRDIINADKSEVEKHGK